MKPRLPRKLKKAMKTKQRLFDKKMGFKFKKSSMKRFMYQQYLKRLYGITARYDIYIKNTENLTFEALKLKNHIEKIVSTFPIIDFASVRDTGESIQGTHLC